MEHSDLSTASRCSFKTSICQSTFIIVGETLSRNIGHKSLAVDLDCLFDVCVLVKLKWQTSHRFKCGSYDQSSD